MGKLNFDYEQNDETVGLELKKMLSYERLNEIDHEKLDTQIQYILDQIKEKEKVVEVLVDEELWIYIWKLEESD